MARLPRLTLAGQAHAVLQAGHGGRPVFADDTDRAAYLHALREAMVSERTAVHAWALLDDEVRWVATPEEAAGLARLVQAVGRRYVSAYNRRHGCQGALWAGRFRSAVLEPGAAVLDALLWVDGASAMSGHSSAAHRSGGPSWPGLTNPAEFWALGNTPFEREARWRERLQLGLAPQREQWLRRAVMGGWAAADPAFSAAAAAAASRPSQPRLPGRPRAR
jgi:putative transposase